MRQIVVEDVNLLHWILDGLAESEPDARVLSMHFTVASLGRHVDNMLASPVPPNPARVRLLSHRGRVCRMLADLPEGSGYQCVIVLCDP
jgi:hypothetical protein